MSPCAPTRFLVPRPRLKGEPVPAIFRRLVVPVLNSSMAHTPRNDESCLLCRGSRHPSAADEEAEIYPHAPRCTRREVQPAPAALTALRPRCAQTEPGLATRWQMEADQVSHADRGFSPGAASPGALMPRSRDIQTPGRCC